jgi:hypothetical protein
LGQNTNGDIMTKFFFAALMLSSFAAHAEYSCTISQTQGRLFNKKVLLENTITAPVENVVVARVKTETGGNFEYVLSAETSCKSASCKLDGLILEKTIFDLDGQTVSSTESQVLIGMKNNQSDSMKLRDGSTLAISCKD